LIVTCEQCATQFQLDDARVPAGGVRVRCSRCKHAFFIEPPAAAASLDPADRAAQDALDAEASPPPDPTEDLAEPGPGPQRRLDEDGDPAGESDWEFNESPFGNEGDDAAAPEQDAARAAIDDLLDSRPAEPRRPAPAPAAAASDELPPDAEEEELGTPESWDFLAGDASPDGAREAASESVEAGAAAAPPRASFQPPAVADVDEWVPPTRPSLALLLLSRTGQTIGWCVTGSLLVLIAALTIAPSLAPRPAPASGFQRLANLQAQGITGRWVENLVAGPLFVVTGRLENPTSEAVPLGVLAGVRLLDANGGRLPVEMAPLGPGIPPRELREADPAALQARQAGGGAALAATPIAPGGGLAFEAVVVGAPLAASRFLIEPLPPARAANVEGGGD
jgi:predicted Zn finger-like uncharacterized protein